MSEALIRYEGEAVVARGAGDGGGPGRARTTVSCPRCTAVLMRGHVLPPGTHDLTCPVCGLGRRVEISGGTLAAWGASVCSALEEWREGAELRRAELLRAVEDGEVAEPVTGAIFTMAVLKGILISAALSIGTTLLTRALTPRQKITSGQLQGAIQVPQSEQGLPVTEGFGADPGSNASAFKPSFAYALEDRVKASGYFYVVTTAGTSAASAPTFPKVKGATVTSNTAVFTCYGRTGGGFRLGMLIPWTSGLRKHVNKVTGGGGGGKGPKPPEQTEITYDLDLAVMPGRGPLRVKRIRANTDSVYQNFASDAAFYEAEAGGNTLTNASVITTSYASGGQTVQLNTSTGAVQFNGVTGSGSSTRIGIGYVASGSRTCEVWVNGVLATTVTLPGSDAGLRWYDGLAVNIPETTGNSVKLVNTTAAGGALLYIDRISVGGSGDPTGVPDPYVPGDGNYTQDTLPGPNTAYTLPTARFSAKLNPDVGSALSGTVQAGANAGIAIYPGNTSQLPDSTIEAAVDAQYGAGSTPAFWNRCLIVLKNFFLTNYGGAIPLIQTLAEHMTLDTLEAIYVHWCGRVGVLAGGDYDFSGVRRVFVRGFPVNPPYAPADVMEELARVFNVYFREADKIYAFVRGSLAPVASLTSSDLSWVDGDDEGDEAREPQGLEFDIAPETDVARRYEITAVDPDRDFEQNSQGTSRQVTRSEKTEKIELALTLYPEEMREVTQRELYEERVEATKHRGALDWSYIWLQPGDSLTIVETDGTTSRVFVESLKPNVGVIPFEGSAEETAAYSQPVSTSGGGVYEVPPVPIPGMTLLGIYDGPLLRDDDNSVNNGAGIYGYPVKRRGDGVFTSSGLYLDRGRDPELIATFVKQAVFGVTATALTASTNVQDMVADALTVDLHNETDTLESFTRDDLWKGAGACIVGGEVCQILTATREPDTVTYPNRWYLTIGLRARRGTDFAVDTHLPGERFVVVDDGVQFVPLNVNELNTLRDYRMVSEGQSVADAAVIPFAWTGGSVKHLAPVQVTRRDDPAGNALLGWVGRRRLGHGLFSGLSGFTDTEDEYYEVEVFADSTRAAVKRVLPVQPSLLLPVVWRPKNEHAAITSNTCKSDGVDNALVAAAQAFTRAGSFFEFTIKKGSVSTALVVTFNWPGVVKNLSVSVNNSTVDIVEGRSSGGTFTSTTVGSVAYADGDRVRVTLVGTELRFYKNYAVMGSVPFYVSPMAAELPLGIDAFAGSVASGTQPEIQKAVVYTGTPQTVYSAAQQVEDFGATQATIYANIYQTDPRVGRGYPAKCTLVNSA